MKTLYKRFKDKPKDLKRFQPRIYRQFLDDLAQTSPKGTTESQLRGYPIELYNSWLKDYCEVIIKEDKK